MCCINCRVNRKLRSDKYWTEQWCIPKGMAGLAWKEERLKTHTEARPLEWGPLDDDEVATRLGPVREITTSIANAKITQRKIRTREREINKETKEEEKDARKMYHH